ncbi:hypothetical protein LPY66_01310 [Dehalobacter sp. DCM]|nr:hypothetical protein LPY66_01310 [Dehalobacter sp. DCM]
MNRYDLFIQYAYAAAKQAMEMANVQETNFNKDRVVSMSAQALAALRQL